MRFELKERHTCREVFHSQEELFEHLRSKSVVLQVEERITQHQFPGQMTYLGDVKRVGVPYREELALYVHWYTEDEFRFLKRSLRKLAAELARKLEEVKVD